MSMKLLIGYDGSEHANNAIDDLRHAGLPHDVEATILTAADVWPPVMKVQAASAKSTPLSRACNSLAVTAMEEAKSLALDGAIRVRKLFSEWKVAAEASANAAGRALIERAEQSRPNILVVGARGRTATAQLISKLFYGMGSVAQQVVRFAPCSVRIGRGSNLTVEPTAAPLRIVIGVDGSKESAAAVQAVTMRAWPAGSEARVITVLDLRGLTLTPYGFAGAALADETNAHVGAWAQHAASRCAGELQRAGLAAVPMVLEGDPQTVLTNKAERWNANCVFVGAHGMSRMERFVLGSVSGAVAERAHCSVEVVR